MLIEIRLLGRFSARRGGEEIPPGAFRQRLTRSLVQILLTRRGSYVARDALTEALWPRRPPADPAANLRVLVNLARRALGDPGLLLTAPGGYSFAGGGSCVVDAEVFVARVAAGQRELAAGHPSAALGQLQAALELWGGEPLADSAHEGWAREYRSRLGRTYGAALEAAAGAALEAGDPQTAPRPPHDGWRPSRSSASWGGRASWRGCFLPSPAPGPPRWWSPASPGWASPACSPRWRRARRCP